MRRQSYQIAVPIILIGLICFGVGNSWTILASISHVLLKDLHGLSGQEYASLAIFFVAGAILATNGATEISRYYGVKRSLLGGLAAIFVGTSVLGVALFSTSEQTGYLFPFLVCSQFFIGLGIGAILTSINAFLVLFMFKRTAVLLTGAYACVNIGSSSSPFLMDIFSPNWWIFPIVLACYFFLIIFTTLKWLPHLHNPSVLAREPLIVIFKKLPPLFWLFVIGVFLYAICEDCLVAWTTILLHIEKNVETTIAMQGLGMFWGIVAIAQISICAIVNKLSPRPIYLLLPCFLAIGCVGIVMAESISGYLLFFAISALGVSAYFALTVNFAEKKFHQIAEFISGAMVLGYFLGTVAGSIGIGFFYQTMHWKLETIFIFIGVIAILLLPVNYFLTRSTSSNA